MLRREKDLSPRPCMMMPEKRSLVASNPLALRSSLLFDVNGVLIVPDGRHFARISTKSSSGWSGRCLMPLKRFEMQAGCVEV